MHNHDAGMTGSMKGKTALLAGATGLVGSEILTLLAHDPRIADVRSLVRRPLPEHDKTPRVVECIADFDRLQEHLDWFKADMVFCALGTTITKAGSEAAFRKVDFDYPLEIAKLARSQGARHFLLVSAVGADPRSRFFYNRVKGELEAAVRALGYPSLTIARPSLLLGDRKEHRFGEEIAKRFSWMFPSPWRGVQASVVASALVRAAHEERPGAEILDNVMMRTGNERARAPWFLLS
jgi:uncharacterized protein YbjT (DUF2867 family)